jgi:hypothetical protein
MIITEHLSNQRPTDEDISEFEKVLSGTLPGDYKEFLRSENGGRPKPNEFRFPTAVGKVEDSRVHYFFGLNEGRKGGLEHYWEMFRDRIPSGCFAIGKDPFGNLVVLGIGDRNRGTIYFWDHEKEPGTPSEENLSTIAPSFSEFINGLA